MVTVFLVASMPFMLQMRARCAAAKVLRGHGVKFVVHHRMPVWVRPAVAEQVVLACADVVEIDCYGNAIDSSVAKLVMEFPEIRSFNGSAAGLTDSAVASLAELPNLTSLDLSESQLSDNGLGALARASQLEYVNLSHTRISDHGLESLYGLGRLGVVVLLGTATTSEGIGRLEAALPDTLVVSPMSN